MNELALITAPVHLAHTDWLHHSLVVTGSRPELDTLREAAAGAGIIPWVLDLDRMEEDWFHHLVAPGAQRAGGLSLAGSRALARQLRERVATRHTAANALIRHSRACAFDLHALCPVPDCVLRLGPDDPVAIAWLWENWGTTLALRHVSAELTGEDGWRVTFWSADWTPWRALAALEQAWSTLSFTIRPDYEMP